jgi:hypothetical protein
MPALYDRFPLKFKLPEQNGGVLTELDVFPGLVYYTTDSDLLINDRFSSVFSDNFNVFSSSIAPRLVRYVPSENALLATYYKGIYIYNPSIEQDGVAHECARDNIIFSVTGGSSFILNDADKIFFEGDFYLNDLNSPEIKSGINKTSVNDNILVSVSPSRLKNQPLAYFEADGSSPTGGITSREYLPGNLGIPIPSLNPGEYFGLYLKFNVSFSVDKKPIDYSFLNITYDNLVSTTDSFFPARDVIPGISVANLTNIDYYNQSFALRFETSLTSLRQKIADKVEIMYDNFPPFFSDFREED